MTRKAQPVLRESPMSGRCCMHRYFQPLDIIYTYAACAGVEYRNGRCQDLRISFSLRHVSFPLQNLRGLEIPDVPLQEQVIPAARLQDDRLSLVECIIRYFYDNSLLLGLHDFLRRSPCRLLFCCIYDLQPHIDRHDRIANRRHRIFKDDDIFAIGDRFRSPRIETVLCLLTSPATRHLCHCRPTRPILFVGWLSQSSYSRVRIMVVWQCTQYGEVELNCCPSLRAIFLLSVIRALCPCPPL